MTQIDLNKYKEFVDAVTSDESKDNSAYQLRHNLLQNCRTANIPQLMTAAMGLCAESGEFTEIVKKMLFQGKPLDADNIFHMKRELGDVLWYWMQGCLAMDVDPNEIVQMNIDKLKARYPGGEFDAHYSENRQEDDV